MFKLEHKDPHAFSFVDEPQIFSIDDYQEVRDQYVASVKELPGVEAIYQMGGVSSPGVSDLDLIVVLNDGNASPQADRFSTRQLDEKGQYLFMHPGAMVTNHSTFEQLPLLIYAANLTILCGTHIPQKILSEREATCVGVAVIVDHSIHLLQALMKYVVSNKIYIRRVLMSLASIKHTMKLIRTIGIQEKERWRIFVNEMETLKNTWLEKENKPLLLALLEEGINVLLEVVMEVTHYMKKNGLIKESSRNDEEMELVFLAPNAAAVFCQKPERIYQAGQKFLGKKGLMLKVGQTYMNMTFSLIALPASLYDHLLAYTHGTSWLAKSLGKVVLAKKSGKSKEAFLDEFYHEIMKLRVDLWGQNLTFLSQKGLLEFDVMPFLGARGVAISGQTWKGSLKSTIERYVVFKYNRYVLKRHMWNDLLHIIK